MNKLWQGRFSVPTDRLVEEFNASIEFDKLLYKYDIQGSLAHGEMLYLQGILTKDEFDKIATGLRSVEDEIERGDFKFCVEDEDIHMSVEKRLTEIIGPVGGKLHTARSRNDQVCLDFTLYIKDKCLDVTSLLLELMTVIVDKSEKNVEVIMPGFTHLQVAQPILYSHWLLSYYQMFRRDYLRFKSLREGMVECPLGACALGGTSFDIDRFAVAKKLGFEKPSENSLDTVSNRDFVLEFLSFASICMMHLSRLSEELIIFSSTQFDFLELGDQYTTGSSIMPQKKNPDVPELIRGKTGRVYGSLMSLLTTMKGLPLAYNKDMQEDKEQTFDAVTTLINSLRVITPMLKSMDCKEENMLSAASSGYSNATDLADYLAKKGLTFRESHEVVGKIVAFACRCGKKLEDIQLSEFKDFCSVIDEGVYSVLDVASVVNSRNSYGSTSRPSVMEQLACARSFIDDENTN